MNNAERVAALESLLERVKRNAAAPRESSATPLVQLLATGQAPTTVTQQATTKTAELKPLAAQIAPKAATPSDAANPAAPKATESTKSGDAPQKPLAAAKPLASARPETPLKPAATAAKVVALAAPITQSASPPATRPTAKAEPAKAEAPTTRTAASASPTSTETTPKPPPATPAKPAAGTTPEKPAQAESTPKAPRVEPADVPASPAAASPGANDDKRRAQPTLLGGFDAALARGLAQAADERPVAAVPTASTAASPQAPATAIAEPKPHAWTTPTLGSEASAVTSEQKPADPSSSSAVVSAEPEEVGLPVAVSSAARRASPDAFASTALLDPTPVAKEEAAPPREAELPAPADAKAIRDEASLGGSPAQPEQQATGEVSPWREPEKRAPRTKSSVLGYSALFFVVAVSVSAVVLHLKRPELFGGGAGPAPTQAATARPAPPEPTKPTTAATPMPAEPASSGVATSATANPTATATAATTSEPAATATATAAPSAAPTVEAGPQEPAPPGMGFLTVKSNADAQVYVGGKPVGSTNQRLTLPCKAQWIRVGRPAAAGAIEWLGQGQTVTVACDKPTEVTMDARK